MVLFKTSPWLAQPMITIHLSIPGLQARDVPREEENPDAYSVILEENAQDLNLLDSGVVGDEDIKLFELCLYIADKIVYVRMKISVE